MDDFLKNAGQSADFAVGIDVDGDIHSAGQPQAAPLQISGGPSQLGKGSGDRFSLFSWISIIYQLQWLAAGFASPVFRFPTVCIFG